MPVAGYMPPVVTSPGTLPLHARHYRVLTVTPEVNTVIVLL